MPAIPAWLYALLSLAIKVGSPYLLKMIKDFTAKWPKEILDLINGAIAGIKDPTFPTPEAKRVALKGIREYRKNSKSMVGNSSEIKKV